MKPSTTSIAILSGKGGVGKTNIALNLSYVLHQARKNVLIMDCDIGLANMDILLGLTPEYTLLDILHNNASPEKVLIPLAEDTIFSSKAYKLDFLPATSGITAAADLDTDTCNALCRCVNPLAAEYDFFILDIGAGISPMNINLTLRADMRVIIITPEPTSLTDSYAMMKVLATTHGVTQFHLIVNQADSDSEVHFTYRRLADVCERFLGFRPELLGSICNDRVVSEAVIKQKPFVLLAPDSSASNDLRATAGTLLATINKYPQRACDHSPLLLL